MKTNGQWNEIKYWNTEILTRKVPFISAIKLCENEVQSIICLERTHFVIIQWSLCKLFFLLHEIRNGKNHGRNFSFVRNFLIFSSSITLKFHCRCIITSTIKTHCENISSLWSVWWETESSSMTVISWMLWDSKNLGEKEKYFLLYFAKLHFGCVETENSRLVNGAGHARVLLFYKFCVTRQCSFADQLFADSHMAKCRWMSFFCC